MFTIRQANGVYKQTNTIDELIKEYIKEYGGNSGGNGVLTEETLQKYALKSDIPDHSIYALKSDIPDMSSYAKLTNLDEYAKKDDIINTENEYKVKNISLTLTEFMLSTVFELDSFPEDGSILKFEYDDTPYEFIWHIDDTEERDDAMQYISYQNEAKTSWIGISVLKDTNRILSQIILNNNWIECDQHKNASFTSKTIDNSDDKPLSAMLTNKKIEELKNSIPEAVDLSNCIKKDDIIINNDNMITEQLEIEKEASYAYTDVIKYIETNQGKFPNSTLYIKGTTKDDAKIDISGTYNYTSFDGEYWCFNKSETEEIIIRYYRYEGDVYYNSNNHVDLTEVSISYEIVRESQFKNNIVPSMNYLVHNYISLKDDEKNVKVNRISNEYGDLFASWKDNNVPTNGLLKTYMTENYVNKSHIIRTNSNWTEKMNSDTEVPSCNLITLILDAYYTKDVADEKYALKTELEQYQLKSNTTITHYCPIEGNIDDFVVGAPVYLTGKVYKYDKEFVPSTSNDTIDCICSVKTNGTWKEYVGICTSIDTKNNCLTFASGGDYMVKVTDSSCYNIGDQVFIDDDNKLKILAGATAITSKIQRMTIGIVTGIIDKNILAVFK